MLKGFIKDIGSFFDKLNKMSITDKMLLTVLILICSLVISYVTKKCNLLSEHLTNLTKDDEFIMYSRTNCPHCISAKPEFEKLISVTENDKSKHVKCKIIDENSNDDRYNGITGYPTFKLHKSDGSEKSFTGERTLDKFKEFISNILK